MWSTGKWSTGTLGIDASDVIATTLMWDDEDMANDDYAESGLLSSLSVGHFGKKSYLFIHLDDSALTLSLDISSLDKRIPDQATFDKLMQAPADGGENLDPLRLLQPLPTVTIGDRKGNKDREKFNTHRNTVSIPSRGLVAHASKEAITVFAKQHPKYELIGKPQAPAWPAIVDPRITSQVP